jgi:hypothetical protein
MFLPLQEMELSSFSSQIAASAFAFNQNNSICMVYKLGAVKNPRRFYSTRNTLSQIVVLQLTSTTREESSCTKFLRKKNSFIFSGKSGGEQLH